MLVVKDAIKKATEVAFLSIFTMMRGEAHRLLIPLQEYR